MHECTNNFPVYGILENSPAWGSLEELVDRFPRTRRGLRGRVVFFRYANLRGAKSVKSPSNTLLAPFCLGILEFHY